MTTAAPALDDDFRPPGFDSIRAWLNERYGIYYPPRKEDLLVHRLTRVLDRYSLSSLEDLAQCIETAQRSDIILAVLHAASTNHTYFFREPQVLDFFRDRILPQLAALPELRIWSAASSTGDEAYTAAILACETFGRMEAANRVRVLGTDISEPVIATAEAGLYSQTHLEQTPNWIISKYFRPSGMGQSAITNDIRRMCMFRRLNLKAPFYPFQKHFHIVFCRNVLYYFEKHDQSLVLESIYDVTEAGGWLLTSVTEAVRDLGTRWTAVGGGIYRKLP